MMAILRQVGNASGAHRAARPARRHAAATHYGGWTLVEVAVVVGLTSLLLGLIVSFADAMFRLDARQRHRIEQRLQTARLADMLREDLQRARRIELQNSKTLRLTMQDDRTVRYELDGETCRRKLADADRLKSRREFWLGERGNWRLDRSSRYESSRAVAVWIDWVETEVPSPHRRAPVWVVGRKSTPEDAT